MQAGWNRSTKLVTSGFHSAKQSLSMQYAIYGPVQRQPRQIHNIVREQEDATAVFEVPAALTN